jgi:uncharacterized protein
MDSLLIRLLMAAFSGGVGFLVFLVVINRILGRLRDRISKPLLGLTLLLTLTGSYAWLGFYHSLPWGLGLAIATLALLALGETRQRLVHHTRRAQPPVQAYHPDDRQRQRLNLLRPITTTDLWVQHYEVAVNGGAPGGRRQSPDGRRLSPDSRRLPSALRRLRIAHLTDLHVNPALDDAYFRRVTDEANAANPDLVLLTGDFITHAEHVDRVAHVLAPLQARLGKFAIFGNHDHWAGEELVCPMLDEAGFHYLGNGYQRLESPGLPPLLLAGCEAPWNRQGLGPLPERLPGEVLLVLSHTADPVAHFSQWGAAAVFTGHYHAGQFCLPLFGPIVVPSNHGRLYARGHFLVDQTHLFVSAGVGCAGPALRLYCPPELLIVDLWV